MKEAPFNLDYEDENGDFDLKEILYKYLRHWRWFLIATLLCLSIGFIYVSSAAVIYSTVAKIKIIDDSKEMDIATDALSNLRGTSKINIENEIEVLKSYRLLRQVVNDLQLDISYYEVGNVKSREIWDQPFEIIKNNLEDSLIEPLIYTVEISLSEFIITDEQGKESTIAFESNAPNASTNGLPFSIQLLENTSFKNYEDTVFKVAINPFKKTVLQLASKLQVEATNKTSEILYLSLEGENFKKNEVVINAIINKFSKDGILDRQVVSKRTLDFIDERFLYLSGELDSIESGKQDFKQSSNLSYIEEDATSLLQKKSIAEAEVFDLETQISLSRLLKSSVTGEAKYGLLPSDIGLENNGINDLVSDYNELALERIKMSSNIGANHPSMKQINGQLEQGKNNILSTINVYQRQLNVSLSQLNREKNLAGEMFSRLPEKEKILRSIERQQSIKENLFLLLLQKREEAAINYAVTAPTIKVVDYGLTRTNPLSPNKKLVYVVSLFLGLFIPFGLLYMRFLLDDKIHDKSDIEKQNLDIPILAEIPLLKDTKNFVDANDRSPFAESFRALYTNVSYILPKQDGNLGGVVFVTSAIKGEGKTWIAFNLAMAYSSMNKHVLLVSADLRNPELDNFFINLKNSIGLSDYLLHPEMVDFKACIQNGSEHYSSLNVCLSGSPQKNPASMFANSGFEKFIGHAKKEFDYVIVDTAPTLLVSDTLLISRYADLTLFIIRSGLTNKRLLDFSKELNSTGKLQNMVYALNAFENGSNYGYGYGYSNFEEYNESSLYHKFINQLMTWWRSIPLKSFFQKLKKIVSSKYSSN